MTLATAVPQVLRPLVPSAEGIAAILMQVAHLSAEAMLTAVPWPDLSD